MSHIYELTCARTLTPTQTLWNQRGHRSQPTHGTRADLFFPRGGSPALHTAQISSTCSSAGSLDDDRSDCTPNGWTPLSMSSARRTQRSSAHARWRHRSLLCVIRPDASGIHRLSSHLYKMQITGYTNGWYYKTIPSSVSTYRPNIN